MQDDAMRAMLIEYMEKGFLENIISLLRQEPGLCRFIPDLMSAEPIRVRLGAMALIEEFARGEMRSSLGAAVPGLTTVLSGHENPTVRGDAAAALGLIGDRSSRAPLQQALSNIHPAVRDAAREALEEFERRG